MITFKKFLEAHDHDGVEYEEDSALHLEDLLRKECSPFLTAAAGHMIYRGIKKLELIDPIETVFHGVDILVTKKNVRTDRRPKDTAQSRSSQIDDWFEDKFGIRVRQATAFVVGDKAIGDAHEYGTACAIFPIGKFKCYWSPKVLDLYSYLETMPNEAWHNEEMFKRWMGTLEYTDKDFDKALQFGGELMIACKSYYAIPINQKPGLTDMLRKMMRDESWRP